MPISAQHTASPARLRSTAAAQARAPPLTRELPTQAPQSTTGELQSLVSARLGVGNVSIWFQHDCDQTPELVPPSLSLGQVAATILEWELGKLNELQQLYTRQTADAGRDHGRALAQAAAAPAPLAFARAIQLALKNGGPQAASGLDFQLRETFSAGDSQCPPSWLLGGGGGEGLVVSQWVLALRLPTVEKMERLAAPPRQYIVHLNRHIAGGGGSAALDKSPVRFGDTLDLSPVAITQSNSVSEPINTQWTYSLYAVCFHQGATAHHGHYFSFVRPLDVDDSGSALPSSRRRGQHAAGGGGGWVYVSDENVEECAPNFHPSQLEVGDTRYTPRGAPTGHEVAAVLLFFEPLAYSHV